MMRASADTSPRRAAPREARPMPLEVPPQPQCLPASESRCVRPRDTPFSKTGYAVEGMSGKFHCGIFTAGYAVCKPAVFLRVCLPRNWGGRHPFWGRQATLAPARIVRRPVRRIASRTEAGGAARSDQLARYVATERGSEDARGDRCAGECRARRAVGAEAE
jgi:hypothetical protein